MAEKRSPAPSPDVPIQAEHLVKSFGETRAVRMPRTPSAGLGSPACGRKARGLSAPASRVRITTTRPGNASNTGR